MTGGSRAQLRTPVAALTLLTRIPAGRWVVIDGEDLARSAPWFPLVGAGVGAAVGVVATALATPLSPLLAAALAVSLETMLTGALHLDGLGDTADALGARTSERALEIMRDHAIGAYGAVAITLDLLIRTAGLSALAAHRHALPFAVAAGALSRMAPTVLAALLPYARNGPGTGLPLTRGGVPGAVSAVIVAAAVAVAVAGTAGAVIAACVLTVTAVLGYSFRRRFGGVTGDALGTAVELSEATALVVAVALVGAG